MLWHHFWFGRSRVLNAVVTSAVHSYTDMYSSRCFKLLNKYNFKSLTCKRLLSVPNRTVNAHLYWLSLPCNSLFLSISFFLFSFRLIINVINIICLSFLNLYLFLFSLFHLSFSLINYCYLFSLSIIFIYCFFLLSCLLIILCYFSLFLFFICINYCYLIFSLFLLLSLFIVIFLLLLFIFCKVLWENVWIK